MAELRAGEPASVRRLLDGPVGRSPEAVALVGEEGELSYLELERRVRRLGRYLLRRGLGPEDRVGLHLERSPEAVIALLAVLRAGGAYVPLDPGTPPGRLRRMLADSRPALILSREPHCRRLDRPAGEVLCLDREREAVEAESEAPLCVPSSPQQLAYVLYTSGSTGEPKGVAVPEASVTAFLRYLVEGYRLTPSDVVLQLASLGFDMSVSEVLGTLAAGGRLVVTERLGWDPRTLLENLRTHHVTALFGLVPSLLAIVLDLALPRRAEDGGFALRLLVVGGEKLPLSSVRRARELFGPDLDVINKYGPTECTGTASDYRVSADAALADPDGIAAVGRPHPHVTVHVLDRRLRPVAGGEAGELLIGGLGVSRGYAGDRALTAEKLVPDASSPTPGARLFRSGDLARRRGDGELEILGRVDHQVKIRGFRVEPGEVEATLVRHPAVRRAVVVLDGRPGGGRLVAHVVPRAAGVLPRSALREYLGERLPEPMVPSSFVAYERFPLTPRGKVDRRALAAPDHGRPELDTPYRAPATALERHLAGSWERLLALDRVGADDNFFELGGDSLRAARLVNQLRQELGEILHVPVVFRAPTVGELAALLEKDYAVGLQRLRGRLGEGAPAGPVAVQEATDEEVDGGEVLEMRRRAARARPPRAPRIAGKRNRPAIFLLSPPRSGSTLLRVMLAGHPQLFSPPELELLSYATLGERRADLRGARSFAAEGLLRAMMELHGSDADEARARLARYEEQDLPVETFYGRLQEWIGERRLVDKTTTYALDPRALERAEEAFEEPLYVRLVRHPCAHVASYVDAHLEQVFLRFDTPFPARREAELVWIVAHQNLARFLAGVPRRRQLLVRFEDLVTRPRPVLEEVCRFLGLGFVPEMLRPYEGRRMTDGLHPESRMLGDPRFHEHGDVDPRVAERWRGRLRVEDLAGMTREMMAAFGYPPAGGSAAVSAGPPSGYRPPLSFAQQRLWFLHQLEPESPAYNLPSAFCVRGPLDVAALAAGLREVVRRHETLRTRFAAGGADPYPVVTSRSDVPLPVVDLAGLPAVRREAEARRRVRTETVRPFDLARGPLTRFLLLREEAGRHVLFVGLHHVVSDGWSRGVLYRELEVLYGACSRGGPTAAARALPELPIQYADFAVYQRHALRGAALMARLAYWRRQLAGLPGLALPSDRPRPARQTHRGAFLKRRFGADAGRLRRRGAAGGASLYMTALAAFMILLRRTTGQQDLAVGSPVANRDRREVEGLIGFFVNMLVMRAEVPGDPSCGDFLARLRENVLAAYAHQDLPFEKLVEELAPARDMARHPLFQVTLMLRHARPTARLPGLSCEEVELDFRPVRFDLELHLREAGGRLEAVAYYNSDLFDATTLARFTASYDRVLRELGADPGRRLSELPLHGRAERHQLLVEWNDHETLFDAPLRLDRLLEARAAAAGDAIAVVSPGGRWSYRELERRAGRLAHRLRGLGVGPEVRVAICMDRRPELIAALLGTLKAGGTYVPLDPDDPTSRLARLLADCGAPVVLTEERLRGRFAGTSARVVSVPGEDGAGEEAPAAEIAGSHAAYLLYTSGSTGRPKAVVIPHAAICHHMLWMEAAMPLTAADRVLHKTPLTFDASVWELWAPLLAGARLVLAPPGEHRDAAALVRTLSEQRVSVLQVVPSLLQALLEHGGLRRCRDLRRVVCGGERLAPELRDRFFATGLGAELYNVYGPTEATIHASFHRCSPAPARAGVPLGRPISNTRAYVLDAGFRPVPLGAAGELAIGGPGLARGYLGRPRATAGRFVPDPFERTAPGRLYRTGDLVRVLPAGELDFLGRLDRQVKLRGFRIELGEVESALRRHPAVRQAVAAAHERLVAYVVPEGSATADGESWQQEHVEQWQSLYEDLYGEDGGGADATLNTVGWVSSYTGRPIPAEEMREWLEETAGAVLRLGPGETPPRRVLEIGCGTGMVLLRVAPRCERYVGTDFSAAVLDALAPQVEGWPQVSLLRRRADELAELGEFDAVVLSSVVQYFPSVGYLLRVLRGAVERLAPGGSLYLGDVRSLPLHEAFCASVELDRAPAALRLAELRERIRRRRQREEELVIDPALFPALRRELPRVREVSIRPRGGRFQNEMTRFRYDVTLRLDTAGGEAGDGFERTGVGDPRWAEEGRLPELLRGGDVSPPTVAGLRKALRDASPAGVGGWEDRRREGPPWDAYANNPLRRRMERWLLPRLRDHLQGELPGYMVPSSFVVLDALPLLPSGKVDRRELPAPDSSRPELEAAFVAPRNPAEEALARIWTEVLGVGDVGVHDSFFELGGHSLLATQVVSRVRQAFGVELALRDLFEEPTVAGLAERLGEAEKARTPPVVPVGRGRALPLSFAQQRLWFLHQLDPESPAYTLPRADRLDGRLDAVALERSLAEIVRRHEVLRTTFPAADGRPRQQVAPPGSWPLPRIDLSGLPSGRRRDEARRLLGAEAARAFALAREGPLRTLLLALAGETHLFYRSFHHVASDGWSQGIFHRELSRLYEAFTARPEASAALPELPVQYADFAVWQRGYLRGEVLDAQLAYWRRQLDGLGVPELPTDRPRPSAATGGRRRARLRRVGARWALALPESLVRSLRRLSVESGASLYMTLLAAFLALVHRTTGQRDVAVGSPIANRRQEEVEGLIGFFVNTLVLRSRPLPRQPFRDFLAQVRELCLEAYRYQDLPFEKLVEELEVERDLGRSPLFQVLFALQNAPAEPLKLSGVEVSPWDLGPVGAHVDLAVSLFETEGRIDGFLTYDADLFHRTTLARLGQGFLALLSDVAGEASRSLEELAVTGAAGRQQLTVEWNDTAAAPAGVCLPQLFEAQVDRTPEATALTFGAQRWSYRQLDRRANALARRLRALGVGPETRVGLLCERGPEMVAGLLGVLKSGGAYVPLDPGYPRQRLRHMAEDAGLAILLAGGGGAGVVEGCPVERFGEMRREAPRPEPLAGPQNLAYVIYTSGSTGRPKGVEISHGALAAFLRTMARRPGITAGDVVLAVTTISFDIAALEIFLPLLAGARLALVDRATASDAFQLPAALDASGATWVQATPATWRMLVDAGWEGRPGLRILCGGEALPAGLARSLGRRGAELWNLYGPTEATVWSLVERRPAGDPDAGGKVTIGRPVDGTRRYLLDRSRRSVAAGTVGELYLGGLGLARGYHAQPGLTAARFVPDPFAAAPGERLYETGDLARFLPDGRLEFLGRADQQVKVRGHRVELGDVEAAAAAHPGVRQAAVVTAGASLVGYFVPESAGTPSPAELRSFLGALLPAYMVPGLLVALDALPLTPAGKVDRAGLKRRPAPEAGQTAERTPPRTPAEEMLAEVWRQVLELREVGVRDDFFQLGGHSLLATQVVSRVRRLFGIELPVRSVFERPTLGELAAEVETLRRAGPPVLPVVRRSGVARPPLSFAQQRLWFLQQLMPHSSLYSVPGARRFSGRLDAVALHAALEELVRRHETLRTRFPRAGDAPYQEVVAATAWVLPLVDLAALPPKRRGGEARRRLAAEGRRPFRLASELPLRTHLWRLAAGDHLLFVNTHHVASDAWSLGIFYRELVALYVARTRGEPAGEALPEPPVRYRDFALWQRERLQGEVLEAELAYWRRQLDGVAVLELPADRPRPAVPTGAGDRVALELPAELGRALRSVAVAAGASLYMTLLSGFVALLHRLTGETDVALGSPIANRRHEEVESLIGPFVNTLVLRGRPAPRLPFGEWLARVREVCLEAYLHQDLPFEKLVEELGAARDLGRSPLFQVMLLVQPAPAKPVTAAGVLVSPFFVGETRAHFDLTVSLSEDGEQIGGSLIYSTDLFHRTTVARLARSYETLLSHAAGDPSLALADLPLLSAAERHQLLSEWNDPSSFPGGEGLHLLFAARAGRTPDAVALVDGDERWSYAELDRRANRLARHLRGLGVGPESRVGLLLPRSAETVLALLAVLKAGGAYVPLDPDHPAERLRFLLADAGVEVLVTRRGLAADLRPPRTVLLDAESEAIARHPATAPAVAVSPESLAYVIYTSGSTGQPKGVGVTHRNVVRLLRATEPIYGFGAGDRWTLFHSLAFDFSVWEVWGALAHGGRLVVVPYWVSRSPAELLELLAREEVTVLNQTPSAFRQLVAAVARGPAVPSLRWVIFGGEALDRASVDLWYERCGDAATLVNMYGITETTVHVTWRRLRARRPGVAIGRALPDLSLHLLDARIEEVPIGVAGEVHVGGPGLSRGYLRRPAATAERFLSDPFSALPGSRLYRSGDLARRLPDGGLEYLGRIDHQVQVRGYRIEPGEVEAALREHPSVADVAVVAADDAPAPPRLVAYLVVADPEVVGEVRAFLRRRLPGYMVPAAFVALGELPRTGGGKLDRRRLPAPETLQPADRGIGPRTAVEEEIAAIWCRVLRRESVGVDDNFFDLGGHSLRVVAVRDEVKRRLGHELAIVELFQHPTIRALARRLDPDPPPEPVAGRRRPAAGSDTAIAVVGMSGRFPGGDLGTFHRNLRQGVESITFFSREELLAAGEDPARLDDPAYVPARGVLDGADLFDAAFFHMSPREAARTDPQHRVWLECAWEALENAGYDPRRHGERCGVFAGSSFSRYGSGGGARTPNEAFQALTNGGPGYLATRVSYKLDLRGPSVNVQTACSTSLVAVHLACQSLLARECDLALAGGVSITVPQVKGYLYEEGGVASPDGRCRAFDARAGGIVAGQGAGVIVLKRLGDALAGGDVVHAVVKGSAINNDGSAKVGFTAPSVEGQAAVIREAQRRAGVSPETVTYVEAHGTGTPLGDPVEVEALTRAFRAGTDRKGFCALGSVKSNLGHLDAAAGVAGLIKTVLALKHAEIPPSLHFEEPNPEIDFASSPFFVNRELRPWPRGEGPRRAGVSSLGVGGTNAHVVLEEAPAESAAPPAEVPASPHLLLLSARTRPALEAATARLAAFLEERGEVDLGDLAFTLQVGRGELEHRRMVVCEEAGEAARSLAAVDPERVRTSAGKPGPRPVVFLFPGGGAQYVNMGRELYQAFPVFRREIDRAVELFEPHLGLDLHGVMYDESPGEDAARSLTRTSTALPALFATELALARLWRSWGVEPRAMIGHSLGEYAAACLSGVLAPADAVALVSLRARLFERLPPGAMASLPLSEDEARAVMPAELDLAALNAPGQCVASGPREAIEAFVRTLAGQGVEARVLAIDVAAHSRLVEPILREFSAAVARLCPRAPRIPWVSNVTGDWITERDATDPQYWVRHLRRTVRFAGGLSRLVEDGGHVLLEVGPGRTLATLAQRQASGCPVLRSLPAVGEGLPETATLLTTLGRLWLLGTPIDWTGFHEGHRRRRVELPTYPFERSRFRLEAPAAEPRAAASSGKNPRLAEWFYQPVWRPAPLSPAAGPEPGGWLLFVSEEPLAAEVARGLEASGGEVVTVRCGEGFERSGDGVYTVDPRCGEDYRRLFADLGRRGLAPRRVVHMWGLTDDGPAPETPATAAELARAEELLGHHLDLGLCSLLFLVRELDAAGLDDGTGPIELTVVTSHLQDVTGEEALCPEKAPLLALCRVAPQERPGLRCRSVDLTLPDRGSWRERRLRVQLLRELSSGSGDTTVAYRRNQRWVEGFESVRLERDAADTWPLRDGGVYLITGGLGRVGLLAAECLARTVRARLILAGRRGLPPRREWDAWLAAHGEEEPLGRTIRKVRALEEQGAEVLVASADAGDLEAMRELVRRGEERFGKIHGVFHAAGLVDRSTFADLLATSRQDVERHFHPKVRGLRILQHLFRGKGLDFCTMTSSISSYLGGLGFTAYAAANLYMDAFARRGNRDGEMPWISVNWDAWPTAEEVEGRERKKGKGFGAELRELAMTPAEAQEALLRTLAADTPGQILVSTGDLKRRIERWIGLEERTAEPASDTGTPAGENGRPVLDTAYVPPGSELEERIAGVWQEVLGFARVGVHDNFFELGGDSLLATQVLSRLRREHRMEVSLRQLFASTTVAQLAAALATAAVESVESLRDDDLEEIRV